MTEETMAMMGPEAMGELKGTGSPKKAAPEDAEQKKRFEGFRNRIELCKQYRRKLIANWVSNIDYRRGKPFASQTDEDRVVVNMDWSLTKAKQAALFSQVPQVRISHPPQTVEAPASLHAFEQRLNELLVMGGIETAMDEVLPDVINAAGIGAVVVSYEAMTEDVQVPAIDLMTFPPQVAQQIQATGMMPNGMPVPMETVQRVTDKRYVVARISPTELLWPIGFSGADFDNAPWIGRSGRVGWAEAKQRFGLRDEDKQKVLASDIKTLQDKLTHDIEKDKMGTEDEVAFDEIFYKAYCYDVTAKSYQTIRRMVFVNGLEQPIEEEWKGQSVDPQTGQVMGALKYPIRVLTLTYISDETIPPSDTAVGRPQVNEINKSRTQMVLQRERSLPIRWFDVNRVDPTIQQNLMRGTWQGMIPVQGAGDKTIGEVARATMPSEDFTFDSIAKNDLSEAWQVGPNQLGSFGMGRQSASEANVVESGFQTRIGRERAKVAKFFVGIAEVLGGLMCLYEDPQSFGEGFNPQLAKALSYSILADSTVLLDAGQRLKRLMDFINFTAKSGWVDVGAVIKEIATLSGLDPNAVVRPPEPSAPVEPNISLRLTGLEDLLNPLPLAMMLKSGQAPDPELIEKAKQLIAVATAPPQGMVPEGPGGPGTPGMPPPGGPGMMPPPPLDGAGGPVPPGGVPAPPPLPPGEANPGMTLMPKINKRADQEL